jgi:hypothetical protein
MAMFVKKDEENKIFSKQVFPVVHTLNKTNSS